MNAKLIDGKAVAQSIKDEIKAEIEKITAGGGRAPALAVVLVGHDPASQIYVKNKRKACHAVGITSVEHLLDESTGEKTLLDVITILNNDDDIDGILVQLPLPKQISEPAVLEHINPLKDVDGFHPVNVGRLVANSPGLRPCTPAGILELLKRSGQDLVGKKVAVLGRSNIVGKPTATLLLHESCTVTICHSKTRHLADITRSADILIAAIGRPEFVTADMVKPSAVVIDVGVNRTPKGVVGDVDFEGVKKVAGYLSPVPGGVGPMTIAMLMYNTLKAYKGLSRRPVGGGH
ncbi:MAG: bifunctional methylenetetrahydrofolate dehydrogenase/methenyltetrahydrofolate cyclohydrolase FolD [Nitrospinae bacterium]|nr:bifunctional methylenetetrahydrofolate dehydrogenase/methenyltetrahydrofolate cyclohydrolase FolD [Nitrospinota bacterium]